MPRLEAWKMPRVVRWVLTKYYDFSVFLTLNKEEQIERLKKRNPNMLNNFIQRWIPLEELYFNAFSIQDKCNILIDTSKA